MDEINLLEFLRTPAGNEYELLEVVDSGGKKCRIISYKDRIFKIG